ncbi:MAG TPA: hypothetical protein PK920_13800 [Phycisphaerae bacterium]|nr:hypothetical protein [Phycisphaerae bacterium]HRT42949.1 hypothetical protein [Phycisphaerae bacterium]
MSVGRFILALAIMFLVALAFLIQYKYSLAATNWTDLARVAVTGAMTLATDTNFAPTRLYRAIVPAP